MSDTNKFALLVSQGEQLQLTTSISPIIFKKDTYLSIPLFPRASPFIPIQLISPRSYLFHGGQYFWGDCYSDKIGH